MRHQVRVYIGVCLVTVVIQTHIAAEPSTTPKENPTKLATDVQKFAEIFAPPGTPAIKDKKWVAVDTGPANFSSDLEGWLVEDTPKEITLLDWEGDLHKLRKPTPNEKRPSIKARKDGNFDFSTIREADHSIAWKVPPSDFAPKIKKFLSDGIPVYKEDKHFRDMSHGRFRLQGHVVDAARYVYVANQLGLKMQTDELYAHAVKAFKKYTESYGGGSEKTDELYLFVADRVASQLRNNATFLGHSGTARAELLKTWERLAAIPNHQYRDEAKSMFKGYQSLIEEDRSWKEPDPKALLAMTAGQKAGYWTSASGPIREVVTSSANSACWMTTRTSRMLPSN